MRLFRKEQNLKSQDSHTAAVNTHLQCTLKGVVVTRKDNLRTTPPSLPIYLEQGVNHSFRARPQDSSCHHRRSSRQTDIQPKLSLQGSPALRFSCHCLAMIVEQTAPASILQSKYRHAQPPPALTFIYNRTGSACSTQGTQEGWEQPQCGNCNREWKQPNTVNK